MCFTRDALKALAHEAVAKGTGARGLRSLLEEIMLEVMYKVPSVKGIDKCTITPAVVRGEAEPKLHKKVKPAKLQK